MDIDIEELLEEYQRTAREAATIDLADQLWDATGLRERVIDLLERGAGVLAALDGAGAALWSAITWTEADPPVALTRALAIVQQRLATAARPESDMVVTMPSPDTPRSDVDAA